MSAALTQAVAPSQAVIAAATVVVWVIELTYLLDDVRESTVVVERSPLAARPDGEDLIPAGAELLRAASFPAEAFRSMPAMERLKHRRHYRAYLLWCRAMDAGKKPDDMRGHVGYDPVMLDEDVERWARPGFYSGD